RTAKTTASRTPALAGSAVSTTSTWAVVGPNRAGAGGGHAGDRHCRSGDRGHLRRCGEHGDGLGGAGGKALGEGFRAGDRLRLDPELFGLGDRHGPAGDGGAEPALWENGETRPDGTAGGGNPFGRHAGRLPAERGGNG